MIALYLGWLIREQIDRARSLQDAIPKSLRHAALVRLAALRKGALEEQARRLDEARAMLDGAGDAGTAKVLSIVRICTRTMGEIEGYGILPLHVRGTRGGGG